MSVNMAPDAGFTCVKSRLRREMQLLILDGVHLTDYASGGVSFIHQSFMK